MLPFDKYIVPRLREREHDNLSSPTYVIVDFHFCLQLNGKIESKTKQITETLQRAKDEKNQLLAKIEELKRQVATLDSTIESSSKDLREVQERSQDNLKLLDEREESLVD